MIGKAVDEWASMQYKEAPRFSYFAAAFSSGEYGRWGRGCGARNRFDCFLEWTMAFRS